MTVYHTAYDTTACKNYRMAKVVDAVQEAQIREYLPRADGVAFVESISGAVGAVPAFKHPLYIHKWTNARDHHGANTHAHEAILAMDLRAAGKTDPGTGQFKVKAGTLYKNLVIRAALTSLWLTSGANAFRSFSPTAMSIFASWISEAIGLKYHLDPKAKIDVMIMAAIFYQSNHVEGTEFDKGNESRYLSSIANALKVNVVEVARIYDQCAAIGSVEDFCTKTKAVLDNVRLENLNAGVLIALMGSTWGGDNAPELCAVALEHPPTWLSLLHEAYTNQALRKVGLSKICERRHYQESLQKLAALLKLMVPEAMEKIERDLSPVPRGVVIG
jgi:hypothetical protein